MKTTYEAVKIMHRANALLKYARFSQADPSINVYCQHVTAWRWVELAITRLLKIGAVSEAYTLAKEWSDYS